MLGSPLKSPQATQLVSRKAKICSKQSNYRTHIIAYGDGDVGRERSEEEQGYEVGAAKHTVFPRAILGLTTQSPHVTPLQKL